MCEFISDMFEVICRIQMYPESRLTNIALVVLFLAIFFYILYVWYLIVDALHDIS